MSRSTIRRGIAAGLAAVTAAAGFAACNVKQIVPLEPPKVTAEDEKQVVGGPPMYLGGPEDHPDTVTMKIRATPTLANYFDALSRPDLVTYLNKLQYDLDTATSEIDSVTCIRQPSGVPCAPTEAARVFIEPEVGMHLWNKSVIPKYGVVAARIINYTPDRSEANFGFPGHSQVWWVVDSIPGGGGLRSRFFVRNYDVGTPPVRMIGTQREFNQCLHLRKTRHKEAKAKFMDCLQSAVYSTAMTGGDPVMQTGRALARPPIFYPVGFGAVPVPAAPYIKALTDTWVTCDAGCCSTSH